MDGQIDGKMVGQTDDGGIEAQRNGLGEWMDGWEDGEMDGCMEDG